MLRDTTKHFRDAKRVVHGWAQPCVREAPHRVEPRLQKLPSKQKALRSAQTNFRISWFCGCDLGNPTESEAYDCKRPNLQLLIGASCCELARKATPPCQGRQLVTSRGAENPGKKHHSNTEIWTCVLQESWRAPHKTQRREQESSVLQAGATP